MTPATDDDAFEAAFEAFLAGRSAPPAAEGLVAFADGVRASAARPPRPTAALAELLATGLLTDQSSAAAVPASAPRRRRSRMFLPTALAKLISASIAAKAATVAGVVVVGVSTAGFTQTLPGPVQTTWNQVVSHDDTAQSGTPTAGTGTPTAGTGTGTTGTGTTGTGTTGTGTTGTGTTGTGTTGTGTTGTGTTGTGTTGTGTTGSGGDTTSTGTGATPNFGSQVSQLAHDNKANGKPGVDGKAVSEAARNGHSFAPAPAPAPAPVPVPGTQPEDGGTTTSGASNGDQTGTAATSAQRGNSGHGSGRSSH